MRGKRCGEGVWEAYRLVCWPENIHEDENNVIKNLSITFKVVLCHSALRLHITFPYCLVPALFFVLPSGLDVQSKMLTQDWRWFCAWDNVAKYYQLLTGGWCLGWWWFVLFVLAHKNALNSLYVGRVLALLGLNKSCEKFKF